MVRIGREIRINILKKISFETVVRTNILIKGTQMKLQGRVIGQNKKVVVDEVTLFQMTT